MSIILKPAALNIKNEATGNYLGHNILADPTIQNYMQEILSAGQHAQQATAAATAAANSATQAATNATNATNAANQATTVLAQAQAAGTNKFSKKYNVTTSTSNFTFNPTGYVYASGDRFEVFVNGLKLTEDTYSNNEAVITITPAIAGTNNPDIVEITCEKDIGVVVDNTLSLNGAAADSKATGDAISDLRDDLSEIAVINHCPNLANPTTAEHGFIESNGDISSSVSWYVSDYIKLPSATGSYTFKNIAYFALYESDKTFIGRYGTNTTSVKTISFTGESNYYARLTSNKAPVDWRFNYGSTIADVEWYADYVNLSENVGIPGQLDDTLTESGKAADAKAVRDAIDYIVANRYYKSDFYRGSYDIYPGDIEDNWYEGQNASYADDGLGDTTTYSYLIGKFDALRNLDTDYVSKNTLGTASGTDANSNQYSIYEYVFKPKHYDISLNTRKVPKVLIQCCQHGFEKGVAYGAYYFFNDLINAWENNEILRFIRHHVEIHFIPVVNPWGFDNSSYYNANDVNLNRNYDCPNWQYYPTGTSDSSGEEPFDQPETQIVRDWAGANSDALLFIDGHTNGHYYSSGYNNMNPLMPIDDTNDDYYNKVYPAFVRHIEKQTYMLPEIYPSITPDAGSTATSFCGRIQTGSLTGGRGTADKWAVIYKKMIGFTFECINGLAVNGTNVILYMSPDAKKIDSEMLGNCIAELLREYSN